MDNQLRSLEAAELEQVTGGFLQYIMPFVGPVVNAIAQSKADKGDQEGAQKVAQWGGIAQQFLGALGNVIPQGGGQTGGTQMASAQTGEQTGAG
jgi:hypothetical protein